MKVEIKHRISGKVLFELTVADKTYTKAQAQREVVQTATTKGVDLRSADLSNMVLDGLSFRHRDLEDATMVGSSLRRVDFLGANLKNVDFSGADLADTEFRNAITKDAYFWYSKNPPLILTGIGWYTQVSGTGTISVGCETFTVGEFKRLTDEMVKQLDPDALPFWNKHKAMLLALCDTYKHEE